MSRRFRVLAALAPWGVGLAAGLLALAPALGPGFALRYDMVFVPNPPLSWDVLTGGGGFPRAVPSDAVVGLLGSVFPGDLVQTLLLLTIFTMVAAGVWRIVPGPWPARLAGAVFAVWNPYLAERLLLGQWALLLGYAGLPWVLAAATRIHTLRDAPRMILALLPAAVGGFSSVLLSGLVAGGALLVRPLRVVLVRACVVAGALAVISLPWLIPALGASASTDSIGAELFAARADIPFGVAGSLLALGGIWNAQAVPVGYDSLVSATGQLLLSLAALAGWVWLLWRGPRIPYATALSVAAAVGFTIALVGSTTVGQTALAAGISAWPGFGPLRDGQLYLAPLALLQAVGIAGVAQWIGAPRRAESENTGTTPLVRATGVALALLSVALLPGLAWGAGGALSPVRYSEEWHQVQQLVDEDPDPGAVLSLPWSAYRGMDRMDGGHTVVLDPATKLFERPVVWNDALRVETPDGLRVTQGEDPLARAVGERIPAELAGDDPATAGQADDGEAGLSDDDSERFAADLADLGVRYVLVHDNTSPDNKNMFTPESPGFVDVHSGTELRLLRVDTIASQEAAAIRPDESDISGLEVTGWLVTVGAVVWSIAASRSSWSRRGPPRGETPVRGAAADDATPPSHDAQRSPPP